MKLLAGGAPGWMLVTLDWDGCHWPVAPPLPVSPSWQFLFPALVTSLLLRGAVLSLQLPPISAATSRGPLTLVIPPDNSTGKFPINVGPSKYVYHRLRFMKILFPRKKT